MFMSLCQQELCLKDKTVSPKNRSFCWHLIGYGGKEDILSKKLRRPVPLQLGDNIT